MTWRRVDPYFARRIQLCLFLIAIGIGCDYIVTPAGSSSALTYVERTWLPLWAWGAIVLVCGVAGFIVEWAILDKHHPLVMTPERWRWGWVSNIAHICLFGIFVALSGSVLFDIVSRAIADGELFGWRTALMWGGYAFANLQFVHRLGPPL